MAGGGVFGAECGAVPTENCSVSISTTFNTGTYYLNDSGDGTTYNGIIYTNGSNLVLDGNGSIFIGNFSITGTLITSNSQNNITIKNFKVYNYTYGMWMDRNTNNTIKDNYLERCGNHFRLQRFYNSSIYNNTFYINYTTGNVAAIYIYQETSGANGSNEIYNNNFSKIHHGIQCITNCSRNSFYNNYFFNNSGHHIALSDDAHYNLIYDNRIEYGADPVAYNGIRITGNYNNITNNTIDWQTHIGIDLFSCESYSGQPTNYNRIINNTITNNQQSGLVQLCNSSNNYFEGNVLNNFTGTSGIVHAVYLREGSSNNTIKDLTIIGTIRSDALSIHNDCDNNFFQNINLSGTIGRYHLRDLNGTNNTFENVFGSSLFNISTSNTTDFYLYDSNPSDFSYIKNELDTSNINLYNLTNALIYFSNNSVAGDTVINNNDGNINISLFPNNYSYVLDDYNVTIGSQRNNDPLYNDSLRLVNNTLNEDVTLLITNLTGYEPRNDLRWDNGSVTRFEDIGDSVNIVVPTGRYLEVGWFSTPGCSTQLSSIYDIIKIIVAVAIISISVMLFISRGKILEKLTLGKMIAIAIFILIGLVFLTSIADSIAVFCP